jgi:hypothetical protein
MKPAQMAQLTAILRKMEADHAWRILELRKVEAAGGPRVNSDAEWEKTFGAQHRALIAAMNAVNATRHGLGPAEFAALLEGVAR